MKKALISLCLLLLCWRAFPQASFSIPDTVCVNAKVSPINTSTNASTHFWNFCAGDLNNAPTAQNLGNLGGQLSLPVFMDFVYTNNKYYGFVSNHSGGNLVRLDFGNSLLNTPTAVSLGNFGGIIPNGEGSEGIQVINNEGKWYAIIVGGYPPKGFTPRVLKIEFGTNIENPSPVATNWGNIGNMLEPIDLHVFREGSNWYGLVVNAENNTITRLNFTSSFDNLPTGVNLGNIGNLSYPTGIFAIEDNGEWRVFITNGGNNTTTSGTFSLTRLDFGSTLLNVPTGVNLGNPGNTLKHPRDLTILRSCEQIVGFAVNGMPGNSDLVKFDFRNNLRSTPVAQSLGGFGHFSFPHSISKIFRAQDDLYAFVTNVRTNSISRLRFSGCTNANIPNSTSKDPPEITYNKPGTYNINLTINEGLPTQSSFCKNIVVIPAPVARPTATFTICAGDSIKTGSDRLLSSARWNNGASTDSIYLKEPGKYWLEIDSYGCTISDSFVVSGFPIQPVSLGNDTLLCPGASVVLDPGNKFQRYAWNNGSTSQRFTATIPGEFHVTVTDNNGCKVADTVRIGLHPVVRPDFTYRQDNCTPHTLSFTNNTPGIMNTRWNFGIPSAVSSLTDPSYRYPATGNYNVKLVATYVNGCIDSTSKQVQVNLLSKPLLSQQDTMICRGSALTLSAATGTRYNWYPSTGLSVTDERDVRVMHDQDITYYVEVTDNANCTYTDSIKITFSDAPVYSIMPDTAICEGTAFQLKVSGGTTYNWDHAEYLDNANSATPFASPATTTTFNVQATEQSCNTDTTMSVTVTVNPVPKLALQKSNDINCTNPATTLEVSGAEHYEWQPAAYFSNPTARNPVVRIPSTSVVYVRGTNEYGCAAIDSIIVNVTNDGQLVFAVPNAFTPNGDGQNDCFGVAKWGELPLERFEIYNRFGQIVFSSKSALNCWDGKLNGLQQPPGTYVYIIKLKTNCGLVERKGALTLIR